MDRRPNRTYKPSPTDVTGILPSPDATNTAVMPLTPLRDAFAGSSRHHPASAHDLPLWRPGVSPTAATNTEPAPAEQTEIGTVVRQVVGHVVRHQVNAVRDGFNACRTDLEAAPVVTAADYDDVMRDAMSGVAAIMAELDAVAETLGFRAASVRRLGRGLGTGGMSPEDVLAELQALG